MVRVWKCKVDNFYRFNCLFFLIVIDSGNWILNTTATPAHSNVSSILANMLNGYDSRLRPEFGGKSEDNFLSNFYDKHRIYIHIDVVDFFL